MPQEIGEARDRALRLLSRETLISAAELGLPVEDLKKEAKDIYGGWRDVFDYLWTPEHYSLPAFRERYTQKLFLKRAKQLLTMLRDYCNSAAGSSTLKSFLRQRTDPTDGSIINIKLMSFACGPGTDVVSLIHILRSFADVWLKNFTLRFQVTLVDLEPGWKQAAKSAVRACLTAVDNKPVFITGSWEDTDVQRKAVSGVMVAVASLVELTSVAAEHL